MAEAVEQLFHVLVMQSSYKDVLMPGYTHLQIAMPSSFGLWFGAYAESSGGRYDVPSGSFQDVQPAILLGSVMDTVLVPAEPEYDYPSFGI